MKCRDCQRFGHLSKFCKNSKACYNCGCSPHTDDNNPICNNPKMCVNCKESNFMDVNHSSYDKKCPIFIKQREIQAIKTTQRVDFKTALKIYNEKNQNQNTFAAIVRNPIIYSSNEDLSGSDSKITTSEMANNNDCCISSTIKRAKTSEKISILPKNLSKRNKMLLKSEAKKKEVAALVIKKTVDKKQN